MQYDHSILVGNQPVEVGLPYLFCKEIYYDALFELFLEKLQFQRVPGAGMNILARIMGGHGENFRALGPTEAET